MPVMIIFRHKFFLIFSANSNKSWLITVDDSLLQNEMRNEKDISPESKLVDVVSISFPSLFPLAVDVPQNQSYFTGIHIHF